MSLNEIAKGAVEIIGKEELQQKLASGKKLRIKHGVDPNTTQLHLGYIVNYRVMRRFQDQGHTIILLLGDFTGRIGDPTDKVEARQGLNEETLKNNAKILVELATKVLDKNKLEIRYNSEWWDKTDLNKFLKIASKVSAVRLWERDMFEKRVKQGKPVWTHEFLYPILQAQDSVELESDLTVIGSDQKFNELLARELQKNASQSSQALIIMPILPGTDGKEKMSQSLNNGIGINEKPSEIYGKIMSMPDKNILPYLTLLTNISEKEITIIKTEMLSGVRNPRDVKMRLAREIIGMLYSEKEANSAEEVFKTIFQKRELPSDMQSYDIQKEEFLLDILVKTKLSSSRAEAKRLIEQKAVKLNDKIIEDVMFKLNKKDCPIVLKKGKRFFVKIV
jgi:tyrosyl-tRNA synthetase